ncbi:hypothetical protein RJ639_015145 [Escallonia herrerae]|uniref:CSC1/OSCA1-like N-terminal transmembrane domain-containing protein n=1 Tax=Escallonia herrerae TaxID=1293975 RepID=A0AA88VJL2_9ASTE|nr:hypothetical protein RJ639_015145 [Escallonia herrerae]
MDLSSFLTSLATSFAIFVVLMFLFTWQSRIPANSVVYYLNRILNGLDPYENGSRTRNSFVWIQEALFSTEEDVVAIYGVDTAVYFVFLTTVLRILVLAGLVLLPVLLPVAATGKIAVDKNSTGKGAFTELERLSMGHVKSEDANPNSNDNTSHAPHELSGTFLPFWTESEV